VIKKPLLRERAIACATPPVYREKHTEFTGNSHNCRPYQVLPVLTTNGRVFINFRTSTESSEYYEQALAEATNFPPDPGFDPVDVDLIGCPCESFSEREG
jgi:hypothetical protein